MILSILPSSFVIVQALSFFETALGNSGLRRGGKFNIESTIFNHFFLCLRVAEFLQKTTYIGFTKHTKLQLGSGGTKKSASPEHCRIKRLLRFMVLGV
jgi:hypothetical protein